MIEIPRCFGCKNYCDGKCPAYPDGIPFGKVTRSIKGNPCGNNVKYEQKSKTASQK